MTTIKEELIKEIERKRVSGCGVDGDVDGVVCVWGGLEIVWRGEDGKREGKEKDGVERGEGRVWVRRRKDVSG